MEIQTVQLRWGGSQNTNSCFLPEKKNASSMKQADFSDMFKNATKMVCTSNTVVSPDTLSPIPSSSSAMKTPESTEEDPDNPEPADKGDESSGTLLHPVARSK